MQLVSKISNLCDPDPPTSQTYGRHAISIARYALVHRTVNTQENTCIEHYHRLKGQAQKVSK